LIEDAGSVVGIEILYRVVGQGTRLLSALKAGDAVDLLGPLGRGFRIPKTIRRIYVAAGGIGVAPLVFLMDRLKEVIDLADSRVFLGGRSRSDLLCRNAFESTGVRVVPTTDDGSEGDQCLLTHPLEEAVRQRPPDLIAACGPPGMIACVGGIASRFGIPCQVSLEATMACGLGACLGCAVKPAGNEESYLHVCKDGPVFDIDAIDLG
jgi:dihydroorotate dehydrogenase electron transfer subunit